MSQLNQAFSTMKTNNHPVTEKDMNLSDLYCELCYISSEMMKIAAKQTQAEQKKNITTNQTEEEHKNRISEFFVCDPPTFGENTEAYIAKQWIVELESIFECIECSEDQKVPFAVLRLKNGAFSWWVVTRRNMNAEGIPMTWENFKQVFYKMYFPYWMKNEMYEELCNLQQGDRSVAEYEAEFLRLSFLVSEYVPNEAWEATQFEYGLRPEIRMQFHLKNNNSYTRIRDLALMMERNLNDQGI